jgi:hypothetical protein
VKSIFVKIDIILRVLPRFVFGVAEAGNVGDLIALNAALNAMNLSEESAFILIGIDVVFHGFLRSHLAEFLEKNRDEKRRENNDDL